MHQRGSQRADGSVEWETLPRPEPEPYWEMEAHEWRMLYLELEEKYDLLLQRYEALGPILEKALLHQLKLRAENQPKRTRRRRPRR